MFWTSTAYAMAGGGQGGQSDPTMTMLMMVLMFAVFYFLLIRPQQKRAKEHKQMVNSLRKGDEVITNGGLCGRVVDTQEQTVTVDLGETKVTVLRSAIASVPAASALPAKDRKSKKDAKKTEKQPEKQPEEKAAETAEKPASKDDSADE